MSFLKGLFGKKSPTPSETGSISSSSHSETSTIESEVLDPIEQKKVTIEKIFKRLNDLNENLNVAIANKEQLSDKKKATIEIIDSKIKEVLQYDSNDKISKSQLDTIQANTLQNLENKKMTQDQYDSLINLLNEIYNSLYFKDLLLKNGEDEYLLSELFDNIKGEFFSKSGSDQTNNEFLTNYKYTYIGGIEDYRIKGDKIEKPDYVGKEIDLSITGCCFEKSVTDTIKTTILEENNNPVLEFKYFGRSIRFHTPDFDFVLIKIEPRNIKPIDRGNLDIDPHEIKISGGKRAKKTRKSRLRQRKSRKNRRKSRMRVVKR